MLVLSGGGITIIWLAAGYGLTQNIWLPVVEPTAGFLLAGALVTAQKALYRSTYDPLSGLPGRELFLIQVQQALSAQKGTVSVAFLDLDRFRLINQSFGHVSGDRVLAILASRLRQVLPTATSLARVGGDEFAILFTAPRETVERSIAAIQTAFANPISVQHYRLSVTVSVGLAVVQAGYEAGPEELLRDAHTAMYRAKALQEYRCETFATNMREAAIERLCLESNLLTALDNQEFLLHYQPIVDLNTGQLSGFEALVRWRPPGRAVISPAEFMPIVEETGLILPLGQWIFQRACRQLKDWQQEFPDLPLTMSINLSRRQLRQPDLLGQIETILTQVGIDGSQLQLEITESLVMQDVEAARELMYGLKQLGFRLAIDDFGTGYSSLSYLHKFPTDTLKVDQSFVSRIDTSHEDWEIVQTILALGHKLHMNLVAEGIEKASQISLLRQIGCESGQGFYFSRPLSSRQATALLRGDSLWPLPAAADSAVKR
ncbi:hypothetical protein C7271_22635 [filamentous cyanobacterium CCP5]|nr:hypothetical protein C7271_22635 [filamentous cyanobacterium CCP5]